MYNNYSSIEKPQTDSDIITQINSNINAITLFKVDYKTIESKLDKIITTYFNNISSYNFIRLFKSEINSDDNFNNDQINIKTIFLMAVNDVNANNIIVSSGIIYAIHIVIKTIYKVANIAKNAANATPATVITAVNNIAIQINDALIKAENTANYWAIFLGFILICIIVILWIIFSPSGTP
jgi:hypothetical protein